MRPRAAVRSRIALFLPVLLALGAAALTARPAAAKRGTPRTGRLEVRLNVVAWPAPDSGVFVNARRAESPGPSVACARSDRRGIAVFPSLRRGYYLLTAEWASDTSSALVVPGDTTRVLLHVRQHGHVPSVFK